MDRGERVESLLNLFGRLADEAEVAELGILQQPDLEFSEVRHAVIDRRLLVDLRIAPKVHRLNGIEIGTPAVVPKSESARTLAKLGDGLQQLKADAIPVDLGIFMQTKWAGDLIDVTVPAVDREGK